MDEIFEWDPYRFIIKSLPINGLYLIGEYRIEYKIYLQNMPQILLDDYQTQYMNIHIFDPCTSLDIRMRPVICFSLSYIKDSMPQWMVELEDQVIAFGYDYTYAMGLPVDNYERPIKVIVNFRKADFVSYSKDQTNSLIVTGRKMKDTYVTSYKVTVETVFIDVFGQE